VTEGREREEGMGKGKGTASTNDGIDALGGLIITTEEQRVMRRRMNLCRLKCSKRDYLVFISFIYFEPVRRYENFCSTKTCRPSHAQVTSFL